MSDEKKRNISMLELMNEENSAQIRLVLLQLHTTRERVHVLERRMHAIESAQHVGATRLDVASDALVEMRKELASIAASLDGLTSP